MGNEKARYPPPEKKGHKLLALALLTVLTCLLTGCVFTESDTTTCPYCGAQITAEEAGDHRIPGCGFAEHAICVTGDSAEHDETCEICSGPLCVTSRRLGHTAGFCGLPGHCWEDGKAHYEADCKVSGHYECDDAYHNLANCDVKGHYMCVVGAHNSRCGLCFQPLCVDGDHGNGICNKQEEEPGGACPTCGDPLNDGDDHGATDCHFKSTHRHCDGMEHTRCDICKGWLCNGNTHIPGICNVVPSKAVEEEPDDQEDSSHEGDAGTSCPHCGGEEIHRAPCGRDGHYSCDDQDHGTAHCGHGPACTLNYSFHSYGPCHAHYTCAEGYQEDQHNTPMVCAIHYDCDPAAQGIDHSICGTCNRGLCSDYHRAHCG